MFYNLDFFRLHNFLNRVYKCQDRWQNLVSAVQVYELHIYLSAPDNSSPNKRDIRVELDVL